MASRYDVVVIGGGLGGLTAGAMLARAGRKVLLIERNSSFGGAASTYKVGDLVVEAALHETADPRNPIEPKHHVLSELGLLDAVEWIPTGPLYEVRGGPLDAPFQLPEGFAPARAALTERFAAARSGIDSVLGDMEHIAHGLGVLSKGSAAFWNPIEGIGALAELAPVVRDWRHSLHHVFERAFGDNEGPKWALAANLAYYHDDPATLWWIFYAVAQGGYLAAGGRYIRGGSQRLSNALARAIRAAGGEIKTGRIATAIRLDADGHPVAVQHTDKRGGDLAEAETLAVAANAAPGVIADMLETPARDRFSAAYADRRLSTSLFSITFGMAKPLGEIGCNTYSTFILPPWLKRLADIPRCAGLLRSLPGDDDPLIALVNYTAIDSGLGGPPYTVCAAGFDSVTNWTALDKESADAKREQWKQRIVRIIDAQFPGFADNITTSAFSTASSMQRYLNSPHGALYGFAPVPPAGPIWRGVDRSPATPVSGLYLASSYASSGGFTGAIMGGAAAARCILSGR